MEREQPITLPAIKKREAAEMVGTQSADLEVGIGIELAATFLNALGVPLPNAKAAATLWKGASSMSFEVRDVEQHEVDVGELGEAVAGSRVRRASPAAAVFFAEPKVRMFVLTRMLTSPHFGVRSSSKGGQSLDLTPPPKPFFGTFERLFYLSSLAWLFVVAIDLAPISG